MHTVCFQGSALTQVAGRKESECFPDKVAGELRPRPACAGHIAGRHFDHCNHFLSFAVQELKCEAKTLSTLRRHGPLQSVVVLAFLDLETNAEMAGLSCRGIACPEEKLQLHGIPGLAGANIKHWTQGRKGPFHLIIDVCNRPVEGGVASFLGEEVHPDVVLHLVAGADGEVEVLMHCCLKVVLVVLRGPLEHEREREREREREIWWTE